MQIFLGKVHITIREMNLEMMYIESRGQKGRAAIQIVSLRLVR